MNILTKVFVVLMCIFSIALVALIVPYAANVDNYREQVEAAEASAASARLDAAEAQERISEGIREKMTEISNVKTQLAAEKSITLGLKSTITGLEAEVKRQEGTIRSHEATIASQSSTVAQLTGIQKDLRDELTKRRAETVDLTKKAIEIEAANNELVTARDTLRRQVKLNQETIASLESELLEVKNVLAAIPDSAKQAADGDGSSGGVVKPAVAIRGQVTAVQKAGEDITLAQLNIGSVAGVKSKMEFIIHRNSEYLGTLVITTVDEQNSAGTLRTVRAGAAINAGDQAIAGPIGR